MDTFSGIVISCNAVIGDNVHVMQNVTIGMKTIAAFNINFYLLGNSIIIGNNVKIGAMSFINKDIIDNCTVFTKKNEIIIRS
ncbi:MAG: hypothetical protein J6562_03490 [Candidatus Schmidhempelia sp.]|nr:hypothetical protein [Candidatus Schmidhempelia sp.]